MSSRVHDPADMAFNRRVLAVTGLAFPGCVFRNDARVLGDRVEAVLLLAAPTVMPENTIEHLKTLAKETAQSA